MKAAEYIEKKKAGLFYGYWILAATFILLCIHSGCSFYSFGLFVKPLQAEFGWSRAGIMMANTIMTVMQGASGILIGRVIDRYGSKRIIMVGAVVTCLCLVLLGRMNNLSQFYFLYGLAGFGFCAMGFLPVSFLVFKWFRKRRGLAIGISGAGIGAGGFIMPIITGSYLIPSLGWRNAFLVLGLLVAAVIIPLSLMVIRAKPEDMGLQPDGDTFPVSETGTVRRNSADNEGLSLKMAMKTRTFWLMAFSGAAFGFSSMGAIQNQAAHLQDIGFPVAAAAGALGAVGIGSGVGKLGFGIICDWMKPRYVRAIGIVCQIIGIVILMNLTSSSSVAVIWLYSILIGLGLGSWLPTMSLLTSTHFGMVAYATISATSGLFHTIGGSTGPLIAGYIFDTQQSYHLAFIIFLVLYALALVATLALRHPKTSP
ncbi:MAG: MFS transporter [Chloroflexota bacterium]